jgi:hypothetical protein
MPFKSSLARSVGKLLGVYKETDLSLRGDVQSSRCPGAVEATGGHYTYTGPNNLKYHIFTPTTPAPASSFVVTNTGPSSAITLLLIGGGGGGGAQHAGGGGAGTLFYREDYPFSATTYPVSIGAGGAAGSGPEAAGGQGGNSVFGSVTVNGGGAGGGMGVTGANGGSGGGGGMRPTSGSGPISGGTATGSPTDPGSPYVHAYDGGAGSDYQGSSPNAGMGGGGGGAGSVGSSTPDTVSPKGPWPAATGAVSPTNMYGQGGNDYSVPTTFMPTDVVLGIAAEMGAPASFLGVAVTPTFSSTPYAATLLFGGGGAGGSHGPWGNFNDNGEYPTGGGGGSGTPTLPGWGTGGVGGNGGPTGPGGANNDIGHPGVAYRGAGGGGSAAAFKDGGAGGHGVCIVAYPIL